MNSKILVTLAVSSLVLASGAFAAEGAKAAKKEHAKGTHKGHVSHKSVGASEDRCDDLRKQLDDLNASYQERIGALEQEVADLQEDQHNHDTLLLDPERGSWQLGFDLWWADADGGDIGFASRVAGNAAPAGSVLLSNALRSTAGDDTSWSASLGWQAKDDTNFKFKFSRFDSDNAYNAQSTTPGVFLANPFTSFASTNGLQAIGNAFTQVDGFRNVDVDDYGFERDTRMFASKKFAMNFQWGIRGAKVDDTQTFVYNNAGTTTRQTATRSSKFQGWGPSAGLSGRYYISDSFEIQGGVGGAALLGDSNFAQLLTLNTATNVAGSRTASIIDVGNRTQDVKPVLDMSSKLVWHAGNHLDLHVGYQTTRYFNAITSDFGVDRQEKDLNLSGFRAGVLWNFD